MGVWLWAGFLTLYKHVYRAIQAMDFYLHEMLGVANWTDRFEDLGLTRETVQSK